MYDFGVKLLFVFIFSFLISFYLVPLFAKVAFKLNILDIPDGNLKKHKAPTPYLGGLAIWFGFIVSSSLVLPFEHQFFLYIMASTILLFIGLFDDLIALTPMQKFLGQFIAVLCYLKAGFYLKVSFFSSSWNILISAFWFLLIINAFNLVDVMDGLATTIACAVTICYIIFALLFGYQILLLFLFAFLGALVAFLVFNRPPARIYLGDAGSLFVGGMVASMPFSISWSEYNSFGYFIPFILCAIPLIEVGTLIIVRSLKHQPFFYGSPDHFSIFLQEKGWAKKYILFYVFFLTLLLGIISIYFFYNFISLPMLLIIWLLFLFFWYFILL